MNKEELLKKAYNRVGLLVLSDPNYLHTVKDLTVDMLKQDMGKCGDITTDCILGDSNPDTSAKIITKQDGVIAGVKEAIWFYKQKAIDVKALVKDGEYVKKGDVIFQLKGTEKDLLRTERTGLNLLQRMSGIATLTSELVEKVKGKLHIAATRKTHWGDLDNKAVALGGGMTHRLGLWESIIIKENHLNALKRQGIMNYIEESLDRAWRCEEANFVEIEVKTPEEAVNAAEKFNELSESDPEKPCIIMLDNFDVDKAKYIIPLIKERNDNVIIEASGGITPENILDWAETGVDIVSLGYLTHSAKSVDMSQFMD